MKVQKFFYLTIQGESLDLIEAQSTIKLPCEIYRKGEVLTYKIKSLSPLPPLPPQKTNRWLYRGYDNSKKSSEEFLLEQLTILIEHLSELQYYIERGMAKLELVLYAENATDFIFSTEHISKLNQLGLGVSLSFC